MTHDGEEFRAYVARKIAELDARPNNDAADVRLAAVFK
jgi:hypothetical protein